jgi:DUF1680 family protein
MTVDRSTLSAAVLPNPGGIGALRPIATEGIRLTDGFWEERLRRNRERTIPHGFEQLTQAGTLENFRLAAGAPGSYRALGVMFDQPFPFLDSDVYKWLEAVGWELGRARDPDLAAAADQAIAAVAGAQRDDGYVNTFVQVIGGGNAYRDMAWGHELYCVGHLIQAAVAWHRALGDDRLLGIAIGAADHVERAFGPSGTLAIDGHPEIEMALVELFRTTGDRRYLDLARRMVDARGHGILGAGRFGAAYWQDHATVREAPSVAGHAVRQMYLDCGVVDVAVETGDHELLAAVQRRWRDMLATRTYLTGGLGSRYKDEAFGDPFELPPDLAYTETCAAIASVMLAWRLLLATGDPACADLIERTIYNGVLASVSTDGTRFFYVNPLQRRTARAPAAPRAGERETWYPCACCPPNLMRMFSSWEGYLATTDDDGIQLHQYAAGELGVDLPVGPVRLAVETGYPWTGDITVRVLESPVEPWSLSLRVPDWCESATIADGGEEPRAVPAGDRRVESRRQWRSGDSLTLALEMPARVTEADPRVDATRGCVALERGPLVYCIETADLSPGWALEEAVLPHAVVPTDARRPEIGPRVVGLAVPVSREPAGAGGWPYRAAADRPGEPALADTQSIGAIPYFAWANRSAGAMRVWIPRRPNPS